MGRNTCSFLVDEGPTYAKDETEKQIYIEHDNEFFYTSTWFLFVFALLVYYIPQQRICDTLFWN